MYSERFQKFIEMWQKDFAIERTIDEKVCVDRDGNPLPWYTYPAIEYLSQFDYGEKTIFEDGGRYDVIVVDGKRRAECAAAAVQKLAPGGMIILDDSDRINTSREYVRAVGTLREADLIQVDFYGFCPMNCYTKTTSLFLTREFDFKSRFPVQPINGIGNLWSFSRRERKEFYKKNG